VKLINPEVRIETTNLCNSNCIMCPRESLTRPHATMGLYHFKKLAVQAKMLCAETISLFGFGEPLLDNTIADKVMFVSLLGMEPIITTNASLLTQKKTHDLLESGIKQIRFSMHGLGESYNQTHIGLSWRRTIKNITHFLAMSRGAVTTHVSVIPMHGENIDAIKEFWLGMVDYLEIWRPHNWVYGKDYRKPDKRKATCGRPFSGPVQINADGKMMVCCFDYDAKMVVGDTYRNTIEEILKGDKFNEIVNKHALADLSGLPCNQCDQLNEYTEEDYPLLYSNRDRDRNINVTSSIKFKLN